MQADFHDRSIERIPVLMTRYQPEDLGIETKEPAGDSVSAAPDVLSL